MTPPTAPPDTFGNGPQDDGPWNFALPRRQKVVLVMDLVESVRLMAANEAAVVQRWHAFAQNARAHVLPRHHGRHVKSLGDGLLAEFDSAPQAVEAAQELHHFFDDINRPLPPDQQFFLRAGLNAAQVYVDSIDIYGAGVNLAARVAALAGPGETMVTAEVRDSLTQGLDADLEDMGECYLKHVNEPVRVWRVGDKGHDPQLTAVSEQATPTLPTIAVMPFEPRSNEPEHYVTGELIADAVIALLSKSEHLRAISRLSSRNFQGRSTDVNDIGHRLGAQFVLSGTYTVIGSQGGGKLLIAAELAETETRRVRWTDRFTAEVGDLLQAESQCAHHLALSASMAILNIEADKVRSQPVATLSAYSLQLSAINLMHRSRADDFERGHEVLRALVERHPRAPELWAWLAKWHVLRVVRGSSPAPADDARKSLDACKHALAQAPNNALALAVEGYARSQLMGEQGEALQELSLATRLAPNEAHAWLYKSVWSTMYGQSSDAVQDAERAWRLSPIDPHSYYMLTILASAYASNRQHEQAIRTARLALRLDHAHTPALRTLLVAQVESGHIDDGRQTLRDILGLQPDFSVERYLAMGSQQSATRQRMVDALRQLGL